MDKLLDIKRARISARVIEEFGLAAASSMVDKQPVWRTLYLPFRIFVRYLRDTVKLSSQGTRGNFPFPARTALRYACSISINRRRTNFSSELRGVSGLIRNNDGRPPSRPVQEYAINRDWSDEEISGNELMPAHREEVDRKS